MTSGMMRKCRAASSGWPGPNSSPAERRLQPGLGGAGGVVDQQHGVAMRPRIGLRRAERDVVLAQLGQRLAAGEAEVADDEIALAEIGPVGFGHAAWHIRERCRELQDAGTPTPTHRNDCRKPPPPGSLAPCPHRPPETRNEREFPPVPGPAAAGGRTRRPAPGGRHPPHRDAGRSGQDRALFPQGHRLRHAGGVRHHPLERARHHGDGLRELRRDRGQARARHRQADSAEIRERLADPRGDARRRRRRSLQAADPDVVDLRRRADDHRGRRHRHATRSLA